MTRTRKLDPVEIRVLGVLMEKEQTTPEHYPLTINGVVSACNQRSNRDPVTDLNETEVVEALDRLRQDALTWKSDGARAERWEHRLSRRWELDRPSKAIMCLLLLRGPQTPGELKSRSERMHPFESVEQVVAILRRLAEGFDALVRELSRRPGQRETRWRHLVSSTEPPIDEPVALKVAVEEPPQAPQGPSAVERLGLLEARVEDLEEELRALRLRLGDLE